MKRHRVASMAVLPVTCRCGRLAEVAATFQVGPRFEYEALCRTHFDADLGSDTPPPKGPGAPRGAAPATSTGA